MKSSAVLLLVLGSLAFAVPSRAGEPACRPDGTLAEQGICAREACTASEAELQRLYETIRERSGDDRKFLDGLEISQKEWRKYFDEELRITFHCDSRDGAGCYDRDSMADYYAYRNNLVRERIDRLEKMFPAAPGKSP